MTMKDVVEFLNKQDRDHIQTNFAKRNGGHISFIPLDHEFLYVKECDALLITVKSRESDAPKTGS